MAKRNLTRAQRKRAAARVARERGVAESQVTDSMIDAAFDAGSITMSDCGSASGYDGGGGFDGGSSYSAGCDSGGGW